MTILRTEVIANLLVEGKKTGAEDPLAIVPTPDIEALKESGSASVDLRLGTWLATPRAARVPCLDIELQDTVEDLLKVHYVPFGSKFYLHPGCSALGITLEWLRFPRYLAGYIIGRSSWGRRGLIIATAAGIHPGFKGGLTLELSNVGEVPIAIAPGYRICQLCLHRAEDLADSKKVDRSIYVGQRRPAIGKIRPDCVAQSLAKAYALTHS